MNSSEKAIKKLENQYIEWIGTHKWFIPSGWILGSVGLCALTVLSATITPLTAAILLGIWSVGYFVIAYSLVPIVLHEVDIDREINTELVEMGVRKPKDWKLIFTSTGWLVACIILVAIRDLFPATRFVVNLIVIGWVLYWGVTILQAFFKVLFLSRHK